MYHMIYTNAMSQRDSIPALIPPKLSHPNLMTYALTINIFKFSKAHVLYNFKNQHLSSTYFKTF